MCPLQIETFWTQIKKKWKIYVRSWPKVFRNWVEQNCWCSLRIRVLNSWESFLTLSKSFKQSVWIFCSFFIGFWWGIISIAFEKLITSVTWIAASIDFYGGAFIKMFRKLFGIFGFEVAAFEKALLVFAFRHFCPNFDWQLLWITKTLKKVSQV